MNEGMKTQNNGLTNQVGDAKDIALDIKDKVGDLKTKVLEVKDTMVDRGSATADKIRSFTQAHPIQAIAIAFAAGYFGMRVTRPLRWL